MKPVNWISATGRKPSAARPTDMPAMSNSARGVSITRDGPKRCCSPSVARKTPPLTPTSSPRTRTRSSAAISCARARFTAWTRESSGMVAVLGHHLLPLLRQLHRQLLEEMVEHRGRGLGRHGEIGVDRGVDLRGAFGQQLLLLGLGPGAHADEICSKAPDRLQLPLAAHLRILALGAGAVEPGM